MGGDDSASEQVPCPCELESHGDLGPVDSSERVARFLNKDKFRQDRTLKPDAFPPKDIAAGEISLGRANYLSDEELQEVGEKTYAKAMKPYEFAAFANVGELRALKRADGLQGICVVDSPSSLPDGTPNPTHADLGASGQCAIDDPHVLEVRKELVKLFKAPPAPPTT